MSILGISLTSLVLIFGSSLLGILIQKFLPEEHLSDRSKEILKASRSVIIGVAALTLGLLIATAKTSFDSKMESIRLQSAKLISLGRILNEYGQDALPIRSIVRDSITAQIDRVERIFKGGAKPLEVFKNIKIISFRPMISDLNPKTNGQEFLKASALSLSNELEELRWRVYGEMDSHIQLPLLFIMVFWLMCVFFSLGLISPFNANVLSGLFLASLSMAAAIFLMLELDRPYQGMITISTEPLRTALMALDTLR